MRYMRSPPAYSSRRQHLHKSERSNYASALTARGAAAATAPLKLAAGVEVEAVLGLPADVHSYALLPIGYPMGRFGPVRRVPVADIVYEDRWGQPYQDQ